MYFKALVKRVRFHHISSDYLANIVTCCLLAIASGLIPSFMRSALVYRDANKRVAERSKVELGAGKREIAPQEWKFSSQFLLADMMKVEKGDELSRCVGIAGGYPVMLCLQREEDKAAAYVCPMMPDLDNEPFEECSERSIAFRFTLKMGSEGGSLKRFINDEGWGWSDFFDRPWDDVACENSGEFNDKKELEVVLTMKKVEKEGEERREKGVRGK
jgi:hypothetical protein